MLTIMKPLSKILFALSLFGALIIIIVPQRANAALEQPPGEFPITEPLRPMEPGIKPNYSGNIQNGEPVNLEETDEDVQNNENSIGSTPDIDPVTGQPRQNSNINTSNSGNGKVWLLGIIVVIVIAGGGWFMRKKKLGNLAKTLVVAALIFFGAGFGLLSQPMLAQAQRVSQGVPQNSGQNSNQPIQRTIIPEDEIKEDPLAAPQKTNKSLYAIITVSLILVAGMAWYYMARNKPSTPAL